MADITLLAAFRLCAPPIGAAAVDGPRKVAMARIYAELVRVAPLEAKRAGVDRAVGEDAAATVFLRFVQSGPRGERTSDPCDDASVGGYLRRALRNEIVSTLRRTNRQVELAPEQLSARDTFDDDPGLTAATNGAVREFFGPLVDRVAAKAPAWFRDALDDRRAVAEGRTTLTACAVKRFGALDPKKRARFDQHQKRMLERLGAEVEKHLQPGAVAGYALLQVLNALKAKNAFWAADEDVKP